MMHAVELFGHYFVWHYTRGFADIAGVYTNVLWFLHHFFSIERLLLTLMSPFRRMQEQTGRGFDPGTFFGTLFINIVLRIIGMVIRLSVIIVGIIVMLVTALGGLLFIALWAFLPFTLIGTLVFGVQILLSSL